VLGKFCTSSVLLPVFFVCLFVCFCQSWPQLICFLGIGDGVGAGFIQSFTEWLLCVLGMCHTKDKCSLYSVGRLSKKTVQFLLLEEVNAVTGREGGSVSQLEGRADGHSRPMFSDLRRASRSS
jgi:hypothetical protein